MTPKHPHQCKLVREWIVLYANRGEALEHLNREWNRRSGLTMLASWATGNKPLPTKLRRWMFRIVLKGSENPSQKLAELKKMLADLETPEEIIDWILELSA
jgi:hypothetical protein